MFTLEIIKTNKTIQYIVWVLAKLDDVLLNTYFLPYLNTVVFTKKKNVCHLFSRVYLLVNKEYIILVW